MKTESTIPPKPELSSWKRQIFVTDDEMAMIFEGLAARFGTLRERELRADAAGMADKASRYRAQINRLMDLEERLRK